MDKEVIKGLKFRIYPNKNQCLKIDAILSAYRFYYNLTLETLIKNKSDNISISKEELIEKYKDIKFDNNVLKINLLSMILKEAIFQCLKTFEKLDKLNKIQKFKSYYIKNSISLFSNQIYFNLDFENSKVKILNMDIKASGIRFNVTPLHRVTISRTIDNKYYISYVSKVKHNILSPPKIKKRIGIDVGLNSLITTSDGDKILNERFLKRMQNRISVLQRSLGNKHKGSRNYIKNKIALQRAYEKVVNKRNDYLNKVTYRIVKQNTFIGVEDLDVKGMEQKRQISKSLIDACFGELIYDLKYKATWNDRKFVKVDRYFPSSQLCSHCGYKNEEVKDLSIREWTCPKCNTTHNRDVNAAKNILKESYKIALIDENIRKDRIQSVLNTLFPY